MMRSQKHVCGFLAAPGGGGAGLRPAVAVAGEGAA